MVGQTNEIVIKAFNISRELARLDWWEMSAAQAYDFCSRRAADKGVHRNNVETVALLAMEYVISLRRIIAT